mgnify:CR=1 FL=1
MAKNILICDDAAFMRMMITISQERLRMVLRLLRNMQN